VAEFSASSLAEPSAARPRRGIARLIDVWLSVVVESVAAALVAAEIVILFSGVVDRRTACASAGDA
jgi:hypothetical protein